MAHTDNVLTNDGHYAIWDDRRNRLLTDGFETREEAEEVFARIWSRIWDREECTIMFTYMPRKNKRAAMALALDFYTDPRA